LSVAAAARSFSIATLACASAVTITIISFVKLLPFAFSVFTHTPVGSLADLQATIRMLTANDARKIRFDFISGILYYNQNISVRFDPKITNRPDLNANTFFRAIERCA